MNSNQVSSFLLFLFGIAVAVMAWLTIQHIDNTEKIEYIKKSFQTTIDADSMRSQIERKVIDSLNIRLADYEKEIKSIKSDLIKTRKRNEDLQIYYNDNRVIMPEF
jgi:predicted  nucleic acid-binding Zn-ribbon protein